MQPHAAAAGICPTSPKPTYFPSRVDLLDHNHVTMHTVFSDAFVTTAVPVCALLGIFFALFLWQRVSNIKVRGGAAVRSENGREYLLEEEQRGESEVRLKGKRDGPELRLHPGPRCFLRMLHVISLLMAAIVAPPACRSRRRLPTCRRQSARAPNPSCLRSTSMSASSW